MTDCPTLMVMQGNVKEVLNTALDLLGRFAMPVDRDLCSAERAQPSPVPSPSFLHGAFPEKNPTATSISPPVERST